MGLCSWSNPNSHEVEFPEGGFVGHEEKAQEQRWRIRGFRFGFRFRFRFGFGSRIVSEIENELNEGG